MILRSKLIAEFYCLRFSIIYSTFVSTDGLMSKIYVSTILISGWCHRQFVPAMDWPLELCCLRKTHNTCLSVSVTVYLSLFFERERGGGGGEERVCMLCVNVCVCVCVCVFACVCALAYMYMYTILSLSLSFSLSLFLSLSLSLFLSLCKHYCVFLKTVLFTKRTRRIKLISYNFTHFRLIVFSLAFFSILSDSSSRTTDYFQHRHNHDIATK